MRYNYYLFKPNSLFDARFENKDNDSLDNLNFSKFNKYVMFPLVFFAVFTIILFDRHFLKYFFPRTPFPRKVFLFFFLGLLSPRTNFPWVFLPNTVFLCCRSVPAVHGLERDIGGLQGTGASAVLLTSGAQRAVSGQMHKDAIAAAVPTADRPVPPAPARGRLQPGRTSGRPRGTTDERNHREDNR